MPHAFSRTELLLGGPGMARLRNATVTIFGIGGVGSFATEALTRSGVGHLVLVDHDVVGLTNLNRQLHATHRTLGHAKVEAMRERILDINPEARVTPIQDFYTPGQAAAFIPESCSYVLDCIDTVTAKLDLVAYCTEHGIPIISSMGTGNKLDPTQFEIRDLSRTIQCPLARTMRKELRKRGIHHLKVLYSPEEARTPVPPEGDTETPPPGRRSIPGSVAFVPSVAGLIMAGEVIRDLIAEPSAS